MSFNDVTVYINGILAKNHLFFSSHGHEKCKKVQTKYLVYDFFVALDLELNST